MNTSTATASSSAPARPLVGKFTASAIAFAGQLGVVTIAGFVGDSSELSSWQERTTDGGRTWAAGPVTHTTDGRYPEPAPTTQIGLAFASASAGWAYQPSLFYTRDGGSTWQAEPGPAAVGAVAVSGSSTWVVGYPCKSYQCQPKLLQTDRVGGALVPLPSQPVRTGDISALLRPTASSAWLLTADPRPQQLLSTADAGRTWHEVRMPCGPNDMIGISGNSASGVYVECVAPSQSMCGSCGAHVLYRATRDGNLTRITPLPTPPYTFTTPTNFVEPVDASTVWAVNQPPAASSSVLRSVDGGRAWHAVLTGTNASPLAVEAFTATDRSHAWAVSMTSGKNGAIGFAVHGTSDAGRTWATSPLPFPTSLH